MSSSPTTKAMTEGEAAEVLALSVATLRAWRQRKQGPRFVRFGRAVRYLPSDIEEYIQRSAIDNIAEPRPDAHRVSEEQGAR